MPPPKYIFPNDSIRWPRPNRLAGTLNFEFEVGPGWVSAALLVNPSEKARQLFRLARAVAVSGQLAGHQATRLVCRGSGPHDSLPLQGREEAQHRSPSADFLRQLVEK
ncbi:hypothetical protein M422DRAFT_249594 [Sphaerobolus stellatus SS14]|uniref:Uncharacterized protein n=1 Tax=Sphaerobolus stellatus (strain SS14) TaxID=990650 RepID=A0A0C9UUV1_SPHS4|nr:hypothetical protein M422DRAFT_249594 [Sphaerobolus stellatus SS14]